MTTVLIPGLSRPQPDLDATPGGATPGSTASGSVSSRDVRLAAAAQRALLAEAELFPKPALVDPLGHSTHPDMDLSAFIRSAISLGPAFQRFAALGRTGRPAPGPATLAALRPVGIAAEATMRRATGGANTHRGAIFILGLALAACGRVGTDATPTPERGSTGQSRTPTASGPEPAGAAPIPALGWTSAGPVPTSDQVLDAIAEICRGLVTADLDAAASGDRDAAHLSHGRRLYRELGVTGVRGEAEAGFPGVRPALAVLRAGRRSGSMLPANRALPTSRALLDTPTSPNSGHPPNSGIRRPDFARIHPDVLSSAAGDRRGRLDALSSAGSHAERTHPAQHLPAQHPDERAARLDALLTLATATVDTTTLHRGGPAALAELQQRARAVLAAGGARTPGGRILLHRLCRWATAQHLSLGGCADLLALAIFLDEVAAEPSDSVPPGSAPAEHASAPANRRA
jgi:holo-ACP synthase/triphosphoribosyl-dephospho-CoA synthase